MASYRDAGNIMKSFLEHDSCAPVERNRGGYSFNPRLHLGLEYIRLSAFWGVLLISSYQYEGFDLAYNG